MAADAPRSRMPTFFLPHGGGPCFFMDWNPRDTWTRLQVFLEELSCALPERPKAIVVVSAHWRTDNFAVSSATTPGMIYDYYGFPDHTYALRYEAPGAPGLAARIKQLLETAGLAVDVDSERGFDHGVFIPLKVAFPDANVPVVTLSVRADLDPAAHLAAGAALRPLREEGVLIVGSGMSFHNMKGYNNASYGPPSERFDRWLTATVELENARERARRLTSWEEAPDAELCHPSDDSEHLIPLMVAAGAAGPGAGHRIFHDEIMKVKISAYRFD